jgi:hypothetical protein
MSETKADRDAKTIPPRPSSTDGKHDPATTSHPATHSPKEQTDKAMADNPPK